ncbi:STAS/SEC14 domain-containing protein [Arthrobacter sp. ISL-72]|uniref:DUF7793 family protein n=1 Tax=Arthrobacter sp. ISL-72 TaxID=2819114 RepID=UPI001BE61D00|nr:STAS/SEC14 domain-containing protein [Arthrobacter sp. ISL-72]MBT2595167.1 STAS/SEC14 domain-containing protein [Arthrobacter sp. ISL-72]
MKIELAGGKATIALDSSGILQLKWRPGSILEAVDAEEAACAVRRLSGNEVRPLMVEMVDISVTPGARQILLRTRNVVAVALVGGTAVDRVVASALQRNRNYDQVYFTSTESALEWLTRHPGSAREE